MYVIKPVVAGYAIICVETGKIIAICNIRRNAELTADILNADDAWPCACAYDIYPYAKYKVIKVESEV